MINEDTPLPADLLRDSALRRTADRPAFVGYWLAKLRERERLSEDELARRLGVNGRNLHLLALSKVPLTDHDLRAVAVRYAADPTALAATIRGESPAPAETQPKSTNDALPS